MRVVPHRWGPTQKHGAEAVSLGVRDIQPKAGVSRVGYGETVELGEKVKLLEENLDKEPTGAENASSVGGAFVAVSKQREAR